MAFAIDRTCFLLLAFVSSNFLSSVGQCPDFQNKVLREGETLTFPLEKDQKVEFKVAVASEYFNTLKNGSNGNRVIDPGFKGLMAFDDSGLTLAGASLTPGNNKYSTGGIYLFKFPNCNITTKVAVVQKPGLTCECGDLSGKQELTTFSCHVVYIDVAACQMGPTITWRWGDTVLQKKRIIPKRITKYLYRATSNYTNPDIGLTIGALSELTCELTFAAPGRAPVPYIVKTAPDFTDSCDFNIECDNGQK